MAVHGQDHVAHLRHEAVEAVEERRVLVGHRVADGVRDVDRRRAFLDRGGDDLGGVLELGAGRVHRGELDVVDEGLRVRDRGAGLVQHVLAGRAELVDDVDVRRRDERVDARSLRVAYSSRGGLHVGRLSSSEAGDDRAFDLASDRLDRFEVAGRGDREAGLDDVDAEAGELMRDLELLAGVQRDAGRLLAVAQRGVEDADVVRIDEAHDGGFTPCEGSRFAASQSVCGSAAATQIAPPIGGAGEAGKARRRASCAGESKRSSRSCGVPERQTFVEPRAGGSASLPAGRRCVTGRPWRSCRRSATSERWQASWSASTRKRSARPRVRLAGAGRSPTRSVRRARRDAGARRRRGRRLPRAAPPGSRRGRTRRRRS